MDSLQNIGSATHALLFIILIEALKSKWAKPVCTHAALIHQVININENTVSAPFDNKLRKQKRRFSTIKMQIASFVFLSALSRVFVYHRNSRQMDF
jgi:hypothetical protein